MANSIEDNELPKSVLTRIMKRVLPENTNVQANAKLALSKSTILFINYLASAAMEEAASAGQKTISGAHVFKALEALDLEEFIPRLQEEFQAYQSLQRARKAKANGKDKETESSSAADGVASKKRKPSDSESLSAKARKSSSDAKPRDGQDSAAEEDDDEAEKGVEDADQDEEDEEEEEEEDAENAAEKGTLNMNEPDLDDDTKATALDDEGEDSDGF
ncbi:DNA polymerase epsilon subunit 3 [Entomortierella parvispora]|uniref:DNA polymerase epsilon subunit D n=1 Tax=Entomortierella parvispora TaxID=205924 RepID=A0A9P3H675_9FUNG|nr:DNA polymerase epsilon subunit 3 [Entomortierella parvispora]